MTLLMFLSAVVGLVFLLALAYFANRIARTLEAIGHQEPSSGGRVGASHSLLARIAFGVGDSGCEESQGQQEDEADDC